MHDCDTPGVDCKCMYCVNQCSPCLYTQSEVWGVEGVEGAEVEDSVDVIPNTQTVVDMLLCLQQVNALIPV